VLHVQDVEFQHHIQPEAKPRLFVMAGIIAICVILVCVVGICMVWKRVGPFRGKRVSCASTVVYQSENVSNHHAEEAFLQPETDPDSTTSARPNGK
jgi:hypothetical protein